MRYRRMPIEIESPEQLGYDTITNNLSESSVADRRLVGSRHRPRLDELLLCYGDHLGDPPCARRSRPAATGSAPTTCSSRRARPAALFATATSLLEPGDHVVVVRTNYATNLETPPRSAPTSTSSISRSRTDGDSTSNGSRRACGRASPVDQRHVPAQPDGHDARSADARTRSSSWRNASGAVLLVDETYRDLTHAERFRWPRRCRRGRSASRRCRRRTACPGLRVGWAVCRDPGFAETLLAAKEQMLICGATLDEAIAGRVLGRSRPHPAADPRRRADRLAIVREWMAGRTCSSGSSPAAVWSGSFGSARIAIDTDRFYEVLLADHGTYVGPGHWFELDDRHFRLGFGWPTVLHPAWRVPAAPPARPRAPGLSP